jgi:hypothetical protein
LLTQTSDLGQGWVSARPLPNVLARDTGLAEAITSLLDQLKAADASGA